MTRRLPWVVVVAGAIYVLAPGHPELLLSGVPIGQTGIVELTLLVGLWLWARPHASEISAARAGLLAALIVGKVAIAFVTPDTGWLGRYYANEELTPPVERSIDFRGLDATRINPVLAFKETEFPVHFYNDRKYNTGVYREWTMPFSVEWEGHVHLETAEAISAVLTANGRAEVLVDGRQQAAVASAGGAAAATSFTLNLPAGPHVIAVRYRKPAETPGELRLERSSGGAILDGAAVTPRATSRGSRAIVFPALIAGWLLHAAAALLVTMSLWPALARKVAAVRVTFRASPLVAAHAVVAPVVTGFLLLQGLWKSQHLVGHVWTLSGGDDWLNYEMGARDAVLNGLMMSEGGVIGRGQPFSLYPGYAYFVAFVHAVTGESLAGVVLVNFLLLAAATVVAYHIGRRLLGPAAALGGLGWLLLLEQADFVRYYTVTLFSENLYYVLVTLTVWFLIRHLDEGGWRHLLSAAVAGALASITRPSMMLMLPVAVLLIVVARARRDGTVTALAGAAAFATLWMATLSPITLRNYWMSGRAVLITAGQAATFIAYNLPVDDPKYFKSFDGTLFNGGQILIWMFIEHPVASLANYGTKLGFSLGMVHWMGSGTMHPELILTTLLYLAGIVMFPGLRSMAALAMHAFILTHVATLMLTMPSNYGYRMILPPFVVMAMVAGGVAMTPFYRFAAARWPALARADAGTAL